MSKKKGFELDSLITKRVTKRRRIKNIFICIYIYVYKERENEKENNEFVRGKKINRGLWFHV